MSTPFAELFEKLTGSPPFPWQTALYQLFIAGHMPTAADIPTGLGKTSVVAIWLIALLTHPNQVPRRLVYVVNRRTVVDQTTAEVERLRVHLREQPTLLNKLQRLCAIPTELPLALSSLRGQFADNREWSIDPARPAVIVGTVDMIGSGLLFSRYTCGFKTRPLHAALLGQDVLLVHDEAHLEPAFQTLLDSIAAEQRRCGDAHALHVLQLTATSRSEAPSFKLTPDDEKDSHVRQRLRAPKQLHLHALANEKELPEKLTELALAHRDSGRAILIFCRTVEAANKVAVAIRKQSLPTCVLTGTMRGKERDTLVGDPIFQRFLPPSNHPKGSAEPPSGTVYLVATSAGEVGVNISADDLVCDLTTFESIAQRFGRVNRFGTTKNTSVAVVHPDSFDESKPYEAARARTLDLLRQLDGNASSQALRQLDAAARRAAFSPEPLIRPATDILFDAWSLTTIREPLPGRPPIAPYLHGESTDWEPPETLVAWRSEVELIRGPLLAFYTPDDLLADYPLKPHELLRDRSSRIGEQLAIIAERTAATNPLLEAWLVANDGTVQRETLTDLAKLASKDADDLLGDRTLVLPPCAGGLSPAGLLDGKTESTGNEDVSDFSTVSPNHRPRIRLLQDTTEPPEEYSALRTIRVIDTLRGMDDPDSPDGDTPTDPRFWIWLELPATAGTDGKRMSGQSVLLKDHSSDVEAHARSIVGKLKLPQTLADCVVLAARLHDLGKSRRYWQRSIGNDVASRILAKPGRDLRPRDLGEPYRHEFGSLRDASNDAKLRALGSEERDLVLHLIAVHHGRARPHFPTAEAFDPEATLAEAQAIATEVPLRFARLQRRFGRWGLAYLESLLRAADYAASAGIKPATEDNT